MKTAVLTILLLFAFLWSGCNRNTSNSSSNSPTQLSLVVWAAFPLVTNSYRHLEHLTNLVQQANTLIATNPSVLGQYHGYLAENSPLRVLLGIPKNEAADVSWSATIDHRFLTIRSPKTHQRFGRIETSIRTSLVESCHDVEALYAFSEMERRLRQIVGTREEALRLFRGGLPDSPSAEQQRATKAIAEALLLPIDTKLYIHMSAPGGSNMGQGYLRIETVQSNGYPEQIAMVGYGVNDSLLTEFGLARHIYYFGGLRLSPAWTNLNTQGFLLDSKGFPYPKS
ncbi:MAG: hypothetical protein RLZZ350_309 [Verrucomicrobiota bacterium]|jgi:hypothetical protein